MIGKEILSHAETIIQRQEKASATGSAWRIFKIHDDITVEVVATVDCAGSRFQVPLLVNLATERIEEVENIQNLRRYNR